MENIIMGMGNYDKIIKKPEPEKGNLLKDFDWVTDYIKGRLEYVEVFIFTDSYLHDNDNPDKVVIRIKWDLNSKECGYESYIDRIELIQSRNVEALIRFVVDNMINNIRESKSLNGGK